MEMSCIDQRDYARFYSMNANGNDYLTRLHLSRAARALDNTGIYRMQFEYLFNTHKAQIGEEPKAGLYKEWLNIIVDAGAPNTKNFDTVTIAAFDTLLRRRITEEEYFSKRPSSSRADSLAPATESLGGQSWVALAEREAKARNSPKANSVSR